MAKSPVQPPKQPGQQRTRGPSRIRRSEATRVFKAVIEAGLQVRGIEVDSETGVWRILIGEPGRCASTDADVEKWLSKHHAHKR
jgi:hypothetical protein